MKKETEKVLDKAIYLFCVMVSFIGFAFVIVMAMLGTMSIFRGSMGIFISTLIVYLSLIFGYVLLSFFLFPYSKKQENKK